MALSNVIAAAAEAFRNNDAAGVRTLLTRHPELRTRINDPVPELFDAPPITCVRSRAMLDVLLEAGADLNAKSRWWAGGFGLLHTADPDLARYAIEKGAVVDIHAAARLGMLDRVQAIVRSEPPSVHARGGDGQTPLHFAATKEIAQFLLDHGADINARDIDHESTPAQYMLDSRQDVARFLVGRGCETDILLAAALGDPALVQKHLTSDPKCIRTRVSEEFFPMAGGKNGGTIYQWTLGFHVSPHQAAKKFRHEDVFQLLMNKSPAEVQLINACWLEDESLVNDLLTQEPDPRQSLSEGDNRQLAHAARNNHSAAATLMLKAGLPVTTRGQHGGQPLHWASWHGNFEMVQLLLRHMPPLEDAENDFNSTPLGWAIHGSENGWYCRTGNHPAVVEALLKAGARIPSRTDGTDAVRAILQAYQTGSSPRG